jgi:heptosyltransferase-2
MNDLKKILIIQTASLGDVILATPLIEKLHSHYPKARIDFVLKNGSEALLRHHPYLRHVMVWDKSEKKYARLWELLLLIREQQYDLVVNVQRFASSGLLTAFSGAKLSSGFGKNPFSLFFNNRVKHRISKQEGGPHEIERNLKLIEFVTDKKVFYPRLYPSSHDFARMSQYKTKQYITVSPASLWFTKQYPREKWVEFIAALDPEWVVYFLGGERDKELVNSIIKESKHKNSLNLAGQLSLLESAALMRDAMMNYTNDSAPMHLASAMNAPVSAVFCSTVPAFGFGPLSERSFIIETKEKLSCRPCGLHGHQQCPKKHFHCAMHIETKQLLSCLN